jgi:DNA-binding NtrC family response regulator
MNQLENKVKTKNNNQPSSVEASSEPAGAETAQLDAHFSLRSLRAEAEIYAISRTLEYTGWNRRRAAQLLSISYRGILYKIRQHNLTPNSTPLGREVPVLVQELKAE